MMRVGGGRGREGCVVSSEVLGSMIIRIIALGSGSMSEGIQIGEASDQGRHWKASVHEEFIGFVKT